MIEKAIDEANVSGIQPSDGGIVWAPLLPGIVAKRNNTPRPTLDHAMPHFAASWQAVDNAVLVVVNL
jgi:hypothetical protein